MPIEIYQPLVLCQVIMTSHSNISDIGPSLGDHHIPQQYISHGSISR
jgi:hypothetical protein